MNQYNRLEWLHTKAAEHIKRYRERIELSRMHEEIMQGDDHAIQGEVKYCPDLYSLLAQRSMESYHAIMDEIESIHASNFTV